MTLDDWHRHAPFRTHPHAALSNVALGVILDPDDPLDEIIPDLQHLKMIVLNFPKFTDGRAYSTAQLLRGRLGFKGELRAVGDVLFDQLQLMQRCGFTAFEITHEPTIRLLEAGRHSGLVSSFSRAPFPKRPPAQGLGRAGPRTKVKSLSRGRSILSRHAAARDPASSDRSFLRATNVLRNPSR